MDTENTNSWVFKNARELYYKGQEYVLTRKVKHFDDFIFIRLPKTGGTSIEKALWLPKLHDKATTLRDWLGVEEYHRRFSFSIVRNPWALNVSLYHFRKQDGRIKSEKTPTFREWVRLMYVEEDPRFNNIMWEGKPQKWWLVNEEGEVIVDYVAKIENLRRGWEKICSEIGCNVDLPFSNKSKHGRYKEYYDEETKKIIERVYKSDLEHFGYEF